ncbi:MAG: class I SAM-dependent methyltransferase [Burkholderiaceae bacterium]
MSARARLLPAADYGIDAPGVVRNLFLCGLAGLLIWCSILLGLWSGQFGFSVGRAQVEIELSGTGLWVALVCTGLALWMLWDSKVGKLRGREQLLDTASIGGGEHVLDVGCGRGLLLVGAARRLGSGMAFGIDIWQGEDLSGNQPLATLENARREGAFERVAIATADMRRMPFRADEFDAVISRAALHNLYQKADRARALREIARVLKPGGRVVIEDIRHLREYERVLLQAGWSEVRIAGSRWVSGFLFLLTFGSLRPGLLLARKPTVL